MFYEVKSFVRLTKAERPTKEQVAGALAYQYANQGFNPSGEVPVKEHLDELLDRSELIMPKYRSEGVVEADTEVSAIEQIVLVKYGGEVDKDRAFYALLIPSLYEAKPVVALSAP